MVGVQCGPFGLFGFALATVCLNFANAGIFPLNSMNLAMGLALGAGLQGVGGIIAVCQNHFFPAMAFFGYGFFWTSYVLIFVFQPAPMPAPNPLALALYLIVWMLFTICLTGAVWRPKSNWALRILFITVVVLFFLLALENFIKYGGHKERADVCCKVAGAEGIVCGLIALYTAMGELLNPIYGRPILPLGEVEAPAVSAAEHESAVPLTEIRTHPSGDGTEKSESADSCNKGQTRP